MRWIIRTASLGFFIFIMILSSKAQEEAVNLPNAGFDKSAYNPLFIQSDNGEYSLTIGMYTQFRFTQNWRQNYPNNDTMDHYHSGFTFDRTRMIFSGDISRRFSYDFRMEINNQGKLELFVALIQWNIRKNMSLSIGKQFMALGREDWNNPQDLTAIEYSASDNYYSIWTSSGLQLHHIPSNKFRYWVGLGNGAYGSRKLRLEQGDGDISITTRLEWNILGTDWNVWNDLVGRKGRPLGLLLGFGVGHSRRFDSKSLQSNPEKGTQINIDFSVNGNGFHGLIQGIANFADYKENVNPSESSYALYSNFGYWIWPSILTYVRFDYVPANNIRDKTENYASPGIGISYYPFEWTNRIRFTVEYNYLSATINNTIVEANEMLGLLPTTYGGQQSVRVQAQFGF